MQNLTGIDHPALAADDLDSLSQWYCDTLGYSLFFEHPEKPVHILKAPDGTLFEMMQKDSYRSARSAKCSRPAGRTWPCG